MSGILRLVWLFLLLLAVALIGGCNCGDDDPSTSSGQADDDSDDDASDDDVSSDDDVTPDDDITPDDDTTDDDIDCADGYVTPYGGCIRQIPQTGVPGHNGLALQAAPDGTLYAVADKGRDITLYSKGKDDDAWSSMVVAHMGAKPDLAVDSAGNLHMAYTDLWDETVNYATNANGDWTTEPVDDVGVLDDYGMYDAGAYSSIALDSQGEPHIAYHNFDNNSLRYAHQADGDWMIEEFTTTNYYGYGYDTDIEVDKNGHAHIAHSSLPYETSTTVYFTSNKTGTWKTKTIQVGASSLVLLLDENGNDHLTFVQHWTLYLCYVTNESGFWQFYYPDITQNHTQKAPISIDGFENIHITYDITTVTEDFLFHLFGEPDEWQVMELLDETSIIGIAQTIPNDGSIHVVYNNGLDEKLYHHFIESTQWESEVIDFSNAECYAMDLDNEGNPYFLCKSEYQVVLFNFREGIWEKVFETETVDRSPFLSNITVDNNNFVHFAYIDDIDLYYCTNKEISMACEKVLAEQYEFSIPSIAVDDLGNVFLSAVVSTDGLCCISNQTGDWVVEIVDAEGKYSEIKADENGSLHLAYYGTPDFSLRYATNTNGYWEAFVIDETADTVSWPSLAIDEEGNIFIAYSANDLKKLKYAENKSGSWSIHTIEGAFTGKYYSVAVNITSDNRILLVYDNRKLFFSIGGESGWQHGILDQAGNISLGSSRSIKLNEQSLYIVYGAEYGESYAVFPLINR